MPHSIVETTRLVAAQYAAGRTLLVSGNGPDVVSRLEEAGPATWWANFNASLRPLPEDFEEADDRTAAQAAQTALSPTGALVFDCVVVDGNSSTSRLGEFFAELAGGPLQHADSVVILRDPPIAHEGDDGFVELCQQLARDGWFRTPSDLLATGGCSGIFSRSQPTLDRLVSDYERILESAVKDDLAVRGLGSRSCNDAGCRESIEAAEGQALTDRDRLVGMFARVMNLQYELDHLRTIVTGTERELARTKTRLATAKGNLNKGKKAPDSRIKRAVANPLRAAQSLRNPGTSGSAGSKQIASTKKPS